MADTITINRGDTYTRTLNLKDADGVAIDATGWTIYFTVRNTPASTSTTTDIDSLITVTIDGEATGIHTLTLTSTQTDINPGNFFYDTQIKKADGTINSSDSSDFIINGDITRAR